MDSKADAEKLKKPLNVYFRFRLERWNTYGQQDDKRQLFKRDWENIDPDYREKLQSQFIMEMDEYKKKLQERQQLYGQQSNTLTQINKTVSSQKPKQPLNAFFKYRQQKMPTYDNQKGSRIKMFFRDWKRIDPQYKEKLQSQYHAEMSIWRGKNQIWKEKYAKNSTKQKSQSKEKRGEKTKGEKQKIIVKQEDKSQRKKE